MNHLRDRVPAEDVLFTKTISVRGRKAKAEGKSMRHCLDKTPPPSTPPSLQEMVRLVA